MSSSLPLLAAAAAVLAAAAAAALFVTLIKQLGAGKKPKACAGLLLPPGPRPWPVVGNLVDLALALNYSDAGSNTGQTMQQWRRQPRPLHAALAALSRAHGPVMLLRLGSQRVVVASSAGAAREALRAHDFRLAGRAVPAAYRVPQYAGHSMVWSGDDEPRWWHLRGLCRTELLGARRVEAHEGARERKAWEMVGFLVEEARAGREVTVADVAFRAVLDMFGWMVMSRDDMAGGFREGSRGPVDWDLKKDFAIGLVLREELNLEDLFPDLFRGWDLLGTRKEMKQVIGRIYAGFGKLVNHRKEEQKRQKHQHLELEEGGRAAGQEGDRRSEDFLGVLLRCGVNGLQLHALLGDLFMAGIDTTTSCIEWTMAELVKNPHVMAHLRNELNGAMGEPDSSHLRSGTQTSPQLRESELLQLPYLQACIKESLRLHPPAPLLLPHRAKEPCELAGGYHIPEGSVVLVNAWAIGRDPENWGADALVFDPDRFLPTAGGTNHRKDFRGLDFDFIPFGSGRRSCPGMALAVRFVQFLVASMVYYFEWELPGGGCREPALAQLSMEEKQGLVLDRKEPLVLVPKLVGCLPAGPSNRQEAAAAGSGQKSKSGRIPAERRACSCLRPDRMEGGEEGAVDDLQQQSKALHKLTGRVEDRQLDSTRVQELMAALASSAEADSDAMRLREKELAAVKINPADVDIIANELELDKKTAERTLREHKGDAVAAIRHLIR